MRNRPKTPWFYHFDGVREHHTAWWKRYYRRRARRTGMDGYRRGTVKMFRR